MKWTTFWIALSILMGCKGIQQDTAGSSPLNVGDIRFDSKQDDPNFALCSSETRIRQYHNFSKSLQIEGEKGGLIEYFATHYQYPEDPSVNAYVTIRFVINCKGESGRFRMEVMDRDFSRLQLDKKITKQLMTLTKELEGWKVGVLRDSPRDYYQYLTFKLVNGQIQDIMP